MIYLGNQQVGLNNDVTSETLRDEVDELKTEISKALITADSDKSFAHESLQSPQSIKFYGSELGFDTAHYADKKRCLNGRTRSWTSNGVNLSMTGCFVVMNGTGTSTSTTIAFEESVNLPAGTYKIVERVSGITSPYSPYVYAKYEGDSSYTSVYSEWTGGSSFEDTFTLTKTAVSIRLYAVIVKDFVYNNYIVWANIFPGNTTIVDTEATIQPGSEYEYTVESVETLDIIDTMVHESTVSEIVSTKGYVDNHIPDIKAYWTEEIYALPEKFGAVGDGITDDTTALTNCIAYSKSSGKAIRGYGNYKIASPIVLDAQNMDVYLRGVIYTGNLYAVDVQTTGVNFEFHGITSNTIGIRFSKTLVSPIRRASRCTVIGTYISSSDDCIYALPMTIYNTCRIRFLSSANGNCITFEPPANENEFRAGEWVFENSTCACPNGYVAHNVFSSKFYNFTVETDVKYGLLNPENCLCVGWRHREQIDGMTYRVFGIDQDHNNGPLITFTDNANSDGVNGFRYISQDPINWFNLDLSAIQGYETIYEPDTWVTIACNHVDLGVSVHGAQQYSRDYVGSKVYFIGNNLVIAPDCRKESVIDITTVDFRLFDSRVDADIVNANSLIPYLCTDYIIDTDTVIRFNAYFGAVGYNDLTITQQNGHTCVIYDKLGSVLFDGTNDGDGVWHLKCAIDRSSNGRYAYTPSWWCYDGTNEKWEITKIN